MQIHRWRRGIKARQGLKSRDGLEKGGGLTSPPIADEKTRHHCGNQSSSYLPSMGRCHVTNWSEQKRETTGGGCDMIMQSEDITGDVFTSMGVWCPTHRDFKTQPWLRGAFTAAAPSSPVVPIRPQLGHAQKRLSKDRNTEHKSSSNCMNTATFTTSTTNYRANGCQNQVRIQPEIVRWI